MSEQTPPVSVSQWAYSLVGLAVAALLIGVLNTALIASQPSKPANTQSTNASPSADKVAKLLHKAQGDYLAKIDLRGAITSISESNNPLGSDESMAEGVRKALDEAAKDDQVKGVLLVIDSPGGTVAMSQELNAACRRVSAKKPIVASLGDMAASGGYYTAVGTDEIVSNKGTLTASIGVIIHNFNLQELFENKLGVKAVTIKSGRYKDFLSPYRKAKPDEMALVQRLIDDSYQDFLGAVIEGRTRGLEGQAKAKRIASIKAVADGRVVTGRQAMAAGLVDELGDVYFAQKRLNTLSINRFKLNSNAELPLKPYDDGPEILHFLQVLGAAAGKNPLTANLGGLAGFNQAALLPASVQTSLNHPNQPLWILE